MSYNRTIIQGRLVHDPELKQTSGGIYVCQVAVAVDRPIRKGADKESDYFEVVAWRGAAEFLAKHFRKGEGILVDGAMQGRKYEKKDGTTIKVWELIADRINFVSGSKKSDSAGAGSDSGDDDFRELDDLGDLPF